MEPEIPVSSLVHMLGERNPFHTSYIKPLNNIRMTSALFWDSMQRRMVVSYRRFGSIFRLKQSKETV
jgi:hypothetical protein